MQQSINFQVAAGYSHLWILIVNNKNKFYTSHRNKYSQIERSQIMSSSSDNEDSKLDPLAGTKRTLKTTSNDGRELSEKKLRRLEKNRLSARECRRRKREATENMEHEMNILEAENIRLRLQLQVRFEN